MLKCAYCQKELRHFFRTKVKLVDHNWYCNEKHYQKAKMGVPHVPWWKRAWVRGIYTFIVLVILAFLLNRGVWGMPSDPTHLEWFITQTDQNGMQCCDGNDSFSIPDTEWRIVGNLYEVLIKGKWIKIRDFQISKGTPNPTGMAAVWWVMRGETVHVRCFRPSIFY